MMNIMMDAEVVAANGKAHGQRYAVPCSELLGTR